MAPSESREEITTEGGLDARGHFDSLKPTVAALEADGSQGQHVHRP